MQITSLAVAMLGLLLAITTSVTAQATLSAKCFQDWSVEGTFIIIRCSGFHGAEVWSTLDMDAFLGSDGQGHMVFVDG